MNCEEVKANLSPYVAGDIERHGARELMDAHLRECAPCHAVALEWEASHQLLQLHQPPEFDAAFFDSVRRDVLRQISEPQPSLLARLLGQPFGQRTLTYAASLSLLVCAVIFSSYFLRRAPSPVAEVAQGDKARTDNTQKSGSRNHEGVKKNDELVAPPPQTNPAQRREARQADAASKRNTHRGERLATRPQKRNELQVANAPEARRVVPPAAEPKSADSRNQVETVASAEREMLRIELQTADPNIRIIWLSPRTTGSASSSKTNR